MSDAANKTGLAPRSGGSCAVPFVAVVFGLLWECALRIMSRLK
jgi:hypothetical protein